MSISRCTIILAIITAYSASCMQYCILSCSFMVFCAILRFLCSPCVALYCLVLHHFRLCFFYMLRSISCAFSIIYNIISALLDELKMDQLHWFHLCRGQSNNLLASWTGAARQQSPRIQCNLWSLCIVECNQMVYDDKMKVNINWKIRKKNRII